MRRLGRAPRREAVRRALLGSDAIAYEEVLDAADIRELLAGVRAAGTPPRALPLLAWIASHPNAPGELLAELYGEGGREVLLSLALNPALPATVRQALLDHPDAEVRAHANHVTCRMRSVRPLLTKGAQ
jgi:hypothetical protein